MSRRPRRQYVEPNLTQGAEPEPNSCLPSGRREVEGRPCRTSWLTSRDCLRAVRRATPEGLNLGYLARGRGRNPGIPVQAAVRHQRFSCRNDHRVVRLLPLRRAGSVLLHPVLPDGRCDDGAAGIAGDVRGRLRGPALRRRVLRPNRRHRRAQVHVPGDHQRDGRLDGSCRDPSNLRPDRHPRADHPRDPAPGAGPGPRR